MFRHPPHGPHGHMTPDDLDDDEGSYVVAVSGKGGVGKTTVSALLLKYLAKTYKGKDILVVDGDPASNIPEVIGLETDLEKTVSKVTYNLKKKIEKGTLPPDYDKGLALEADIYKIMYELDEFDILVLGRGEGKGCYCFINNLLKNIMDPLEDAYDIIFMDMVAGLEHLSRRTDKNVDELIIVTDMSKMGFNTVERIVEIAKEVHLEFRKFWIIGNRFEKDAEPLLESLVKKIKDDTNVDIELAGFVPNDVEIATSNLKSVPVYKISDDNPAYQAAEKIAKKMFNFD